MVSAKQLGERIAEARKSAGITQADLATGLSLARTTIVAIEKGERKPSSDELVKLAEALGTTLHALLREHHANAEISPRFRLQPGSDPTSRAVRDTVERLRLFGQRYAELEQIHGIRRSVSPLESLQTFRAEVAAGFDPVLQGEEAARTVRGLLGLGDEPALGLDDAFEGEAGMRIFYLPNIPRTLSAMLIWGDEIGACVAINRAHPPERQRWSLVHELGHFLRDRENGDVLFDDEGPAGRNASELFADTFTRAFLLPSSGVRRWFSDRCRANNNRFNAVDIYVLSHAYQVSFQAMALRLEELRFLPAGTYDKLTKSKIRPIDLAPLTGAQPPQKEHRLFPFRYLDLAVLAFDRELISEGQFADFLDTDRVSARQIFQEHEHLRLEDGRTVRVSDATQDLLAL